MENKKACKKDKKAMKIHIKKHQAFSKNWYIHRKGAHYEPRKATIREMRSYQLKGNIQKGQSPYYPSKERTPYFYGNIELVKSKKGCKEEKYDIKNKGI